MADAPKKSGLSLYAHLLGDSASTISGAPVKYDQQKVDEEAATAAQKKKDASLQFQPIKRPQVKAKPKTTSSSSTHKFSSSTTTASANPQGPSSTPSVQRSNFEDWVGDDDDEFYYQDRKQSNKRNKKKKKQQQQEAQTWDWDDIYDPSRPNNYSDYKGSEEQYREHRDWKARLYYYQLKDAQKAAQKARKSESAQKKPANSMFAPPASLNFAPPSFEHAAPPQRMHVDDDDDAYPSYAPADEERREKRSFAPPSFAPPATPDDATGEDAYARRVRMSEMPPPPAQSPPAPAVQASSPPIAQQPDPDKAAKIAAAQEKIAAMKARMAAKAATPGQSTNAASSPPPPPPEQASSPPPTAPAGTISRAPVRYDVPPAQLSDQDARTTTPSEDNEPPADQPRSKKPGQKGFAERMLNKWGWEKGQGLGASGEGITTALVGKVDKSDKNKNNKRSDPEGGHRPGVTMGKIVGGKRRKVEGAGDTDDGRHGKMSDVVKLEDMLAGLDVQKEIEENNLMQEIGDFMGERYGNVERLFIWREEMGGNGEVFVKFTSQLSALRAVNEMDETTFAGNKVVARFYDGEKFEGGEYAG